MTKNAEAMVVASFAADSLALGAHWIYDTHQIDRSIGRVDHLLKPLPDSYHEDKGLGEFTHYGDQTLCLLESLAAKRGFELNHFAQSWRSMFAAYSGYFDQATKATLENFESGKAPTDSGSPSSDLGGASRIAPLIYLYRDDLETLVSHAKNQTAMTHDNAHVVQSAAFFSELAWKVLDGSRPTDAISRFLETRFNDAPFSKWISEGLKSAELGTRQAISNFGQMCETGAALPSVIHLIAKYENDLKEGLVENVMAGGDSAARGLLTGMILGAHLGTDAIPIEWLSALKQYAHIVTLLNTLDGVVSV
jgi:ADP-ribosylglycohydrolase